MSSIDLQPPKRFTTKDDIEKWLLTVPVGSIPFKNHDIKPLQIDCDKTLQDRMKKMVELIGNLSSK
jgi:hypothetical protein